MTDEKDFADVAKKAVAGDRAGAAVALAALLVSIWSGHPILGGIAGGAAAKVADMLIDTATTRLRAADAAWDSDQETIGLFQESLMSMIRVLLEPSRAAIAALTDQSFELYSKLIVFIVRHVAPRDGLDELHQQMAALQVDVRSIRRERQRPPSQWILGDVAVVDRRLILEGCSRDPEIRGAPEDYLTPNQVAEVFGNDDPGLRSLSWWWVMEELSDPDDAMLSTVFLVNHVSGARVALREVPRLIGRELTTDGLVALGLHGASEQATRDQCLRLAAEQASLNGRLLKESRTQGMSEKNREMYRQQATRAASTAAAYYREGGDVVNAIRWEQAARR